MYYAIFDGEDYLETGFNTTSRFEVKEQLLSLLEPETEEADFKKFFGMNVHEICAVKGWTLESSENRFDLRPNFRVIAAVTTYCYLDVRAKDDEEAKRIAQETDGGDYYTMDNEERPGSFNIEEVKTI